MSNQIVSQKITIELVKRLYQPLAYVVWGEAAVALLWMGSLWDVYNHLVLTTWFILRLVSCDINRALLAYRFNEAQRVQSLDYRRATEWLAMFAVTTFASGVSWGLTCSLLMVPNNVLFQAVEIFMIMGITAAANTYYSAFRGLYAIFLLTVVAPLAIWYTAQGGIFIVAALMCVVYMAAMMTTSIFLNHIMVRSLRLRYENLRIVDHLATAIGKMDQYSGKLEKSLSLVKSTLESTSDGIMVVDADNTVTDYNAKFIQMLGVPRHIVMSETAGTEMMDYVMTTLNNPGEFNEIVRAALTLPDEDTERNFRLKDGRVFEIKSRPLRVKDKYAGRVWNFHDASESVHLEEKLYIQANYDSLSGLPNRILAIDRLMQAINLAHQTESYLAVLFVDLDKFKIINDTLGHAVGDQLLCQVAQRLQKCVRENDTVSREGGDEFLMIINSLSDETDSINTARKCLSSMSEPFVIDGNTINISLSIGISVYPRAGKDAHVLIDKADTAMYRAKELGGNNFQFFTEEMNKKAQNRLAIENQLQEALEEHQFRLRYQPIVNLKTGMITGMEPLLSWHHPTLGLLSPDEFMSIAEESGFSIAIGAWVLRTACEQVRHWQKQYGFPLQLSVNVYARQFRQSNLDEIIQLIMLETGFMPHTLALEISENSIMDNVVKNIAMLQRLRDLGVMITIDDFGTGYSSFNYLKQLPVDKLKIDRKLIDDLPMSTEHATLVSAIIALAAPLHLKVIAEGVRTEQQLHYLLKHHCDEIQGDYFSAPMDAEGMTVLLQENKMLKVKETTE